LATASYELEYKYGYIADGDRHPPVEGKVLSVGWD
jgi:hypothetical protein